MNNPVGIPSGWEEIAAYVYSFPSDDHAYMFSLITEDETCLPYGNMPESRYNWRVED